MNSTSKQARLVISVALFVFQTGCVTSVPVEDYNIARAAIESARDADAPRFAPGLWYNAETAYREAQRAYKERHFDVAREQFREARKFSEQAEDMARLSRQQSGDVVP